MNKLVTLKLDRIELILKSAINKVGQIKKCRLEVEEVDYTLGNLFDGLRLIDEIRIARIENNKGEIS